MKPVIIVVDDEQIVRASLKDQLRRAFAEEARVEVVEDGEAAIELVEEMIAGGAEVPVIIADQIMGGMKGDELLVRVHARLPRTRKILLTGQAGADAVGNAVNRAALYRYIAKPWDRDDLVLTVREALRSYLADKRLEEQNAELTELAVTLERKSRAFFRFVPREQLRLMGVERVEDVAPGVGVERDMAMLFADIRDFATICEGLSPTECVLFINRYIGTVQPPIEENGGYIDGFFGDGILAMFERGAESAVRAGIGMARAVEEAGASLAGGRAVRIGIGVNAGRVTLGTIGAPSRMQCSVAGDPVVLASRIESLTKTYGVSMLVSHHVVDRVAEGERGRFRQVDTVQVKGRAAAVGLFEVLEAEPAEGREARIRTLERYRRALDLYYRAELAEAERLFAECAEAAPSDTAALTFLSRCRQYLRDGLPPGWSGVESLRHK